MNITDIKAKHRRLSRAAAAHDLARPTGLHELRNIPFVPRVDPQEQLAAQVVAYLMDLWRRPVIEGVDDEWIYNEICTGELGCGKVWTWLPWDDFTDDEGQKRSGWNRGWCGATGARAWGGVGLRYEIRRHLLPSPSRLLNERKCDEHGFPLKDRLVDPSDMRPGDIVCVDTYGSTRPDHITVCVAGPGEPDPLAGCDAIPHRDVLGENEYRCIGGNEGGYLFDGRKVVGVTTNIRTLDKVRGVVRFTAEDCEVEA